jgi:Glycosyl hydrolases family 15
LNTSSPWARDTPHGVVIRVGSLSLGVCVSDDRVVEHTDQAVAGLFRIRAGQRRVIGVIASHDEPLMTSTVEDVDRGLDRTIAPWSNWSGQFGCAGMWSDAVRRSVLILKLLIFGPAGSIAAAATTSLPERLAGDKNWDYRYAWVRDTAYTVDALHRFGLGAETHASVSWLLRTVRTHGPQMGVLFGLDGSPPAQPETYEVPGWRKVGAGGDRKPGRRTGSAEFVRGPLQHGAALRRRRPRA